MNFLSLQPLGRNRTVPRLWIESQRLNRLGFTPGTPLEIRSESGQLTLTPAILGENHVSSRLVPGGRRPIIDLANQSPLAGLVVYSEVKIVASFEGFRRPDLSRSNLMNSPRIESFRHTGLASAGPFLAINRPALVWVCWLRT